MVVTFDLEDEAQAKEVEKYLAWSAFVTVSGKRLSINMAGMNAPNALSMVADALFELEIGL